MDNALRLQYLAAMGIDVWVPRKSAVSTGLAYQSEMIEPVDLTQSINTELCLCDPPVQPLLGVGNQQADWLLVVAATRTDDGMQDLPFEKKAGLLLAEMLRAIELNVEDVFIVPVVACKALNHDTDQICMENFMTQQALMQPKIILAIGDKAAQALLKTRQPLASLRGQCHYINKIPVVVVEHPAYLLRSLLEKRQAWQDLCFAKQILNNEG